MQPSLIETTPPTLLGLLSAPLDCLFTTGFALSRTGVTQSAPQPTRE
ncbi:hypothetical protein [Nocardia sp. NPDC050710]